MSKYLLIILTIISFKLKANLCQSLINNHNKLLIIVEGTSCYKKDVFESYNKYPLKDFFKHYNYPKRMSLMMGILRYNQNILNEHDIIYIPHRRPKSSLNECINRYIVNGEYETIKVIGTSWGAHSAIKITDALIQSGHRVNALLTLDHVSKGVRVINNLLVKNHKNHEFIQELEVDYWYNFYQKTDKKSMLIGITGNRIDHADIDLEVDAGLKGHVSLYRKVYEDISLRDYLTDFYAR